MIPEVATPIDDASRARVKALCGILARPSLDGAGVESLRALIQSPHWRPVPLLATYHLLEPLFHHHLQQCGIDATKVFLPRHADATLPPTVTELALLHYQRTAIVSRILRAVSEGGVSRAMVIKGAALAPLYPSPALRQMCDLDVVISKDELPKAREIFLRLGFVSHTHIAGEVWHDDASGFHIDLQDPATPLAAEIFHRAIPSKEFPSLFTPRFGDHLLLVAMHAASHAGDRLWRDTCDAWLLLGIGGSTVIDESMTFSRQSGIGTAQLAAMLTFMKAHGGLQYDEALAALNTEESRACKQTLALYEELSADSISPVALNMIRVSLRSLREHAGVAAERLKRRASDGPSHSGAWAETDSVMGTVGSAGTISRQFTKVGLTMQLWRNRQLSRYRKLVRMQDEISDGMSPFHAPPVSLQAANRP